MLETFLVSNSLRSNIPNDDFKFTQYRKMLKEKYQIHSFSGCKIHNIST